MIRMHPNDYMVLLDDMVASIITDLRRCLDATLKSSGAKAAEIPLHFQAEDHDNCSPTTVITTDGYYLPWESQIQSYTGLPVRILLEIYTFVHAGMAVPLENHPGSRPVFELIKTPKENLKKPKSKKKSPDLTTVN